MPIYCRLFILVNFATSLDSDFLSITGILTHFELQTLANSLSVDLRTGYLSVHVRLEAHCINGFTYLLTCCITNVTNKSGFRLFWATL